MLLLLDNCEHLVGPTAKLVADLLAVCPRLVVVAASRQSLGVPGERLFEVGSLAVDLGGRAHGLRMSTPWFRSSTWARTAASAGVRASSQCPCYPAIKDTP
jgi:hypothetical protein